MGAIPGSPGSVIKGWTDGLSLLKKGSKARLYIPSSMAYGSRGAGGQIPPNANLSFDVEVVDVISAAQSNQEESKKKMQMESMQRAQRAPQAK
jgi:FKBP-type peptidyl-prolyl cis-trans isomerase 2